MSSFHYRCSFQTDTTFPTILVHVCMGLANANPRNLIQGILVLYQIRGHSLSSVAVRTVSFHPPPTPGLHSQRRSNMYRRRGNTTCLRHSVTTNTNCAPSDHCVVRSPQRARLRSCHGGPGTKTCPSTTPPVGTVKICCPE